MAREKKINFRYYLNKRLKPITTEGIEQYPVYLRITFNRKQTEMRCFVTGDYTLYWDEDSLNGFLKRREINRPKGVEKLIIKHERILSKIIRERYDKLKDNFHFKGIINQLEYHSTPIVSILYESALNQLDSELKIILNSDKYQLVKKAGLTDKYFAAISLSVGLKENLSESLILLLKAFASFFTFISPYPYEKGNRGKNMDLDTVDAWYNEGGMEKYTQFVEDLSKKNKIWDRILNKYEHDDNVRLLAEFKGDFTEKNNLPDIIENQIVANRP